MRFSCNNNWCTQVSISTREEDEKIKRGNSATLIKTDRKDITELHQKKTGETANAMYTKIRHEI